MWMSVAILMLRMKCDDIIDEQLPIADLFVLMIGHIHFQSTIHQPLLVMIL